MNIIIHAALMMAANIACAPTDVRSPARAPVRPMPNTSNLRRN
jgi:hypothetical protein